MTRLRQLNDDWKALVVAAVGVPTLLVLSSVPQPMRLNLAGSAQLIAAVAAGAIALGAVLVVGRLMLERTLQDSRGRVRKAAVAATSLGAILTIVGSTLNLEGEPRVATAPLVVAWLLAMVALCVVWFTRRSRPVMSRGVSAVCGLVGLALFLASILWVFLIAGLWRAQALAAVLALVAIAVAFAMRRAPEDGLDTLSTAEWGVLALLSLAVGARAVTVTATRDALHGQLQSLFIALAAGVVAALWAARAVAPAVFWRDDRRRAVTVFGVGLMVLGTFRAVAAPWSGPAGELPPLEISPETTHITEPLRADGTPDYAAWINRSYGEGVTPNNNAAVLLARILDIRLSPEGRRRLGMEQGSEDQPTLIGGLQDASALRGALEALGNPLAEVQNFEDAFVDQHVASRREPWRPQRLPLIDAWLDINAEALAQIEQASQRSRFWLSVHPSDLAPGVPVPGMSGFRTAANILAARSFRSLGTGDWESAARDAATIQRLSWLVGQDPMLISRLIAVAIRGIGVGLLPRLAATAPTTTTRDRALLAEVTAIEDLPEVTTALDESERALLLGALLHLRRLAMTSGSGAWIDELEPLDMLAGLGAGRSISMRTLYSIDPRAVDWNQAFQLVNRHFDASVAVGAEPDPQRGSELTRAFEKDFEWLASSPITPPLGFDRRAGRTHASCLLDPTCLFAAYTPTRLVVSALGLGSLIRARVSWNEAQAQYRLALRALELAIEQRERGSFPAELELPRALDGYAYRYHPGPPLPERLGRAARFAVTTVPLVRDETGVRGFCVDGEGRLHQELDGSAPDVIEGRCLGGSSVR